VRVERLCEEFDVEFDAWAYDLRPGLPPEGLPRDEVYREGRYPPGYLDRLRETARESGIEMIAPPVVANTFKAHQATEFAKDGGRLPRFHRAVFAAYWEKGENIGDEEVLCRLARECGLDADGLRAALADGRYVQRVEEQMAGENIGDEDVLCRLAQECGLDADGLRAALADGRYVQRVEEQMAWARNAGLGGVPTFIFNDKFALVGAQDYEVFADVARRIQRGELKAGG